MPTQALGLTKKLLNKSLNNDLETQLEEEKIYQKLAGETNDYKEGVASFLEKRKPKFKGN
jgi:2-(1,2-epoxy-1,2-dihydrophenyl)acetyl-CoA isomerase